MKQKRLSEFCSVQNLFWQDILTGYIGRGIFHIQSFLKFGFYTICKLTHSKHKLNLSLKKKKNQIESSIIRNKQKEENGQRELQLLTLC
jgi:hypothetical protein